MRAKIGNKGSMLLEMMVAGLLMSLAVSSMAGMMLQSASQSGRLQRREQAVLAANQALQALKNYVTADHSAATSASAPNGCWNFRDGSNACLPGWAFDPGAHDVSFLLAASPAFRDPRYGAKLLYTVQTTNGLYGASVSVDWTEP